MLLSLQGPQSHCPACLSIAQIIGFGSALLEDVDPNPANFVGAGIIHTKTTQIGCLLRLEPNLQAQVRLLEEIVIYTQVVCLLWCHVCSKWSHLRSSHRCVHLCNLHHPAGT